MYVCMYIDRRWLNYSRQTCQIPKLIALTVKSVYQWSKCLDLNLIDV